jgi:hypothetical protein
MNPVTSAKEHCGGYPAAQNLEFRLPMRGSEFMPRLSSGRPEGSLFPERFLECSVGQLVFATQVVAVECNK